jgi:MFS family permease
MSKDGPFKAYVVALALGLTSFFMVLSPMALHLAIHNVTLDAFGFHFSPENMFSLAIAWTCILVGVLGLPIAAWSRNFNPRRALACGFLLVGLGTGILGITYSPVGILVAMSVYALGENLSLPVAAAYLAKLSPPGMRGRYIGVASLSWNFAIIAAPQIGVRFIKSSPGFVWGTCVALGVASAAVLLLFGREEAKAAHVALPLPEPVSV